LVYEDRLPQDLGMVIHAIETYFTKYNLSNLVTLNATFVTLTDTSFDKLNTLCPNLTTLDIIVVNYQCNFSASHFKNAKNIRRLIAVSPSNLTDESITLLAQGSPNLAQLCILSGTSDLTNNTLFALANHCTNLIDLQIDGNYNFSEKGIERLTQCCTKLESLKGIGRDDTSLDHVAKNCRNLKHFSNQWSENASYGSIQKVLQSCTTLQYCSFWNAMDMNIELVKSILSLPSILELELINCTMVTIATELNGIQSNVKTMKICFAPIKDDVFCVFISACPKLTKLEVSGLEITNVAMDFVLEKFPNIETIKVDCANVKNKEKYNK